MALEVRKVIEELIKLCNWILEDAELGVQTASLKIIIDRMNWFLGYQIDKLKWLQEC